MLLLLPALFLCTTPSGFTQKLPSMPTPYSFTDLVAAMDLNNVELNKAREAVIQAQLDTKDAKAGYQPTVDLTLAGSYMANPLIKEISLAQGEFGSIPVATPPTMQVVQVPLPNTDIKVFDGMPTFGYSFQLDLQQPIFTWGKISNSVKIFSAVEAVRQLQLTSLKKQKTASLKAQITALSLLSQMEALLSQQQQYAQELVTLTVAAQNQGVVLEQAVLEAQTQEALIPLSLQQIRHNTSVILQDLRELTGLPQLDGSQILHIPQTQGFYETFQELSQQDSALLEVAALNPAQESLAILEKLYQAAEYGRKVASGSIYGKPDIALQISFGVNGNMEKLFKGESDLKQDLVANITLGIKTTVWDGGKKLNQLKRSTSQLKDAELDLEQSRSAIKLELSRQINAMTMATLKIQYQELKIQTAQSQLDQKLQLLESGYGSQREVLQTRIEKITEEVKLLEEKINLATAACTVEFMTQLN